MFSGLAALLQGIDEAGVPGQSIGVVRLNSGSVDVEYGSWGQCTGDGERVTRLAIGSCSKAFTAAAIIEGTVELNNTIQGELAAALPSSPTTTSASESAEPTPSPPSSSAPESNCAASRVSTAAFAGMATSRSAPRATLASIPQAPHTAITPSRTS
ncbi:hypothetical protein V8D89_015154 [Ganoderma adspersum]